VSQHECVQTWQQPRHHFVTHAYFHCVCAGVGPAGRALSTPTRTSP
jgi:hypothetical protein